MSNQWFDDSFEKLERGQTRQQKTPVQKQTSVSDVQKKLKELSGIRPNGESHVPNSEKTTTANFTPINIEKLGDKYKKQDNPELKRVRERLHYLQLQQAGTWRAIEERKREEETRRKKELEEEEEKLQKQKEQTMPQSIEAPKGKERKSIFSLRKKKRAQAEIKPGSGKQ